MPDTARVYHWISSFNFLASIWFDSSTENGQCNCASMGQGWKCLALDCGESNIPWVWPLSKVPNTVLFFLRNWECENLKVLGSRLMMDLVTHYLRPMRIYVGWFFFFFSFSFLPQNSYMFFVYRCISNIYGLFWLVKCWVCFIDSTNHYQLTFTHALAFMFLKQTVVLHKLFKKSNL